MKLASTSRRSFLKRASVGASAAALTASQWSRVMGANGDIRLGFVGFRGRGGSLIEDFRKQSGVRVAALCDADATVLAAGAKRFADQNEKVGTFKDVREMLDQKDLDGVVIATPNHWHSLMGIWACQAGKDAYVEKPVSHNVWEGRKLVEAARKYGRIVQTGTQNRSRTSLVEAFAWLKAGNLGKIKIARALCYKRRDTIGKVDGPQPIPPNVDYNLWCGPAPMAPLMRKELHYDWHWVWSTGCGDVGNQGIHQMDVARWALGKQHLSPRVMSVGGRLGYFDDGTTPNTQMVVHDYGDSMIIFEVRGLPAKSGAREMDRLKGQSVGVIVECEGGYLSDDTAYDNQGTLIKKFQGGDSHAGNFLKAVRSRNTADLSAEILEGHLSSALCHTGNISYRLGLTRDQNEIREQVKGHAAGAETLARMEEHLAVNGVDLKATPMTIGPWLEMNPQTERFTNDDSANSLLTRIYRQPFVVPEKV